MVQWHQSCIEGANVLRQNRNFPQSLYPRWPQTKEQEDVDDLILYLGKEEYIVIAVRFK